LLFAVQANGATIKTIEGLAPNATELHPLQEKFWELHGLQCGFCTPGILLTAEALLKDIPNPSEDEIRQWISGNICRCTGYLNIVTAIQEAAKALTGSKPQSSQSDPLARSAGEGEGEGNSDSVALTSILSQRERK
jgi:carbon-monoxide dehydrogenase small subunit